MKKALVTDLDGTILHAEKAEIPVRGKSGWRYMSSRSACLLSDISRRMPVIIATGRNARSVSRLVDQLDSVQFSGYVLENGLIARTSLLKNTGAAEASGSDESSTKWDLLYRHFKGWERLPDYEECLALIPPGNDESPKAQAVAVLGKKADDFHLYEEPGKLFVYPFPASKREGVSQLNFEPSVMLGDGKNDADIMAAASFPCTLDGADTSIRLLTAERGGYCSPFPSHAGTEDLLKQVMKKMNWKSYE